MVHVCIFIHMHIHTDNSWWVICETFPFQLNLNDYQPTFKNMNHMILMDRLHKNKGKVKKMKIVM